MYKIIFGEIFGKIEVHRGYLPVYDLQTQI